MESMVNLEKEFQNLYVHKNKKGHIKSFAKYFLTAQEKLLVSKSLIQKHKESSNVLKQRGWKYSKESDANNKSLDQSNTSFYNEWALRTCL